MPLPLQVFQGAYASRQLAVYSPDVSLVAEVLPLNYTRIVINGGGRGIRTPARFNPPVGFQDRSLQPDLGIPPNY
jgi:hypothetical protein